MPNLPVIISTWPFGLPANRAAFKVLSAGKPPLDAVEAGVVSCEDDPSVDSVGYGGLPDASGQVTLDASIMDHAGRCGSVAGMPRIRNPIKVARLVMERTKHVMLVGPSATGFALANGLPEQELLTDVARQKWEEWKKAQKSPNSHDTLGLLVLDAHGQMAGGCSTSGMAFKLPGRVGDSPIIGAGLYVDGDVGGASATGVGEEVIKVCGSFAIVENMRRGMDPAAAIEQVLRHLVKRRGNHDTDVSFVALRKDGVAAGGSLRKSTNFKYSLTTPDGEQVITPDALFD